MHGFLFIPKLTWVIQNVPFISAEVLDKYQKSTFVQLYTVILLHTSNDCTAKEKGSLFDLIKGKSDNEAKEIIEDFLGMIKENPELKSNILKEDDKTKLMCLSGVKQYPMRVKCATLSWHTLVSAMENDGKEISTEK